jgi:hypothetical protein
MGSSFLVQRLRQWAADPVHAPIFCAREEPNPVNHLCSISYRLTPLGERLRDVGFTSPTQAPPMFIGGCRLYDPDRTWVRRDIGTDWHIERLRQ